MNKVLYVVRHGKAEGQLPESPLTPEGIAQAEALTNVLSQVNISRIFSSPFKRALQSIAPLAQCLGLPIESDKRLIEATLSSINYPDWLDRLQKTFIDLDLSYEGGESSRIAMSRAVAVVDDILQTYTGTTVIVTHGRLMTLLLKHFDPSFGFSHWRNLTTPDVFRVTLNDGGSKVDRVWK